MATFNTRELSAKLSSLSLFRAGGDGEEVTGAAVKVSIECAPAELVKQLIGANALPGYEDSSNPLRHNILESFWDDEGRLKFWNVGPIAFDTEFEDHRAKLGPHTYDGCKVSKFAAKLRDERRVDLTFSINVRPTDAQLTDLSHRFAVGSVTVQVSEPEGHQEQADLEQGLAGQDPLDGVDTTKLKAGEAVQRVEASSSEELLTWVRDSDNRASVRKAVEARLKSLAKLQEEAEEGLAEAVNGEGEEPGGEEPDPSANLE